jgi:glycosyltransferase involved in cell wall biosynthesis
MSSETMKIISIHWGFMPGGVAVYARHIEKVGLHAPLTLKSLCVNAALWPFDKENAAHMDMHVIEIKGRWDLSWIGKTREFIKKELPDLIMTHGFNGAFVAAVASRGLKVPIVASWHGDYFPSTFVQRVRKPFADLILKLLYYYLIKEIVAVSVFSKKVLVEKGILEDKITVIHNGIPPELIYSDSAQKIRNDLQIPAGCLLAGTACRLAVQKGLEWFLRSVAIVVSTRTNMRFVIWGDGPQKEQLQALVKELGIGDYIIFPGYRSDILNCLPALDIFVMSSYAEYFSIALLEAMRAGLPIVATNVGGNPEAIESGVHGLLVSSADPQALAAGISMLANDNQVRECMGRAAQRRFLEKFSSEVMIPNTAKWLLSCCEKHADMSNIRR